jgi:asparagine synthase (glutamine-hydrolysing)
MSAICGIVSAAAAGGRARRDVALMLDALAPRGPDGAAIHEQIEAGRHLAFGMRQLAVGRLPRQPAVARGADPATALVFDGQIFNHRELRDFVRGRGRNLTAGGDGDQGGGDGELLAHLYELEGAKGFRRIDGQFAVALWDGRRRALVLARDFLGVRPLYYRATAAGVIFASEIKALMAVPDVTAEVDEVAVSHYLTFLTVPGPRTLFRGVSKLAAGSTATFDGSGNADVQPFWDLLWDPVTEVDDEDFYIERVRALHDGAVGRRMIDGPIAALVSGGNDSSANASIMARKIKESGGDPARLLHTFTVGLREVEGDDKYSDLKYARQVADLIGSTHHERLLSTDQFLETIPLTIDALDDLVSEPSSVFLHHALLMAKEQGLKVVVTGEANDELACGHGEMIRIRQRYYERWLPFSRLPWMLKRLVAAAAPVVSPRRTDLLRRAAAGDEYFWNFEIGWAESEKAAILSPEAMRAAAASDGAGAVVARDAERLRASAHGKRDYLNHMIYRMMQDYYFGNLMLGKLDLLSARLGLESRCPYTEPAYAHFVYNIPARFKQRNGVVKHFFKKALDGLLPESIIYRPKQGFRTPVVELFKGPLADWGERALLDGGLTRTGVLRRDTLSELLREHRMNPQADHSNRLWTALVLNLWHQRWIEGARPAARSAETGAAA